MPKKNAAQVILKEARLRCFELLTLLCPSVGVLEPTNERFLHNLTFQAGVKSPQAGATVGTETG